MKKLNSLILLFSSLFIASSLQAKGLILDRTRVIFPLTSNKVAVEIYNSNDYPVLSQLWIDNDHPLDPNIMATSMPLVIHPPVFKLKPKEKRIITLLLKTKKNLHTDRESLFYLNSQEIPPLDSAQSENNQLNISIVNRIKVFLRPKALASKDSQAWIKALSCIKTQESKKLKLHCKNPTGYYATISSISMNNAPVAEGDMIAPFSHHNFILDMPQNGITPLIQLSAIDDNGIVNLISLKP